MEEEQYECVVFPKFVTDVTGVENPPHLLRIIYSKYPVHKPKKGTMEETKDLLTKQFPCLQDLSDEEFEDIVGRR